MNEYQLQYAKEIAESKFISQRVLEFSEALKWDEERSIVEARKEIKALKYRQVRNYFLYAGLSFLISGLSFFAISDWNSIPAQVLGGVMVLSAMGGLMFLAGAWGVYAHSVDKHSLKQLLEDPEGFAVVNRGLWVRFK